MIFRYLFGLKLELKTEEFNLVIIAYNFLLIFTYILTAKINK